MKKVAEAIRVKPGMEEEYLKLVSNPWPDVEEILWRHGVRNHSLFRCGALFVSYYEYSGTDFNRDMRDIAKYSVVREWWARQKPMQEPLPERSHGNWWAGMEEVFTALGPDYHAHDDVGHGDGDEEQYEIITDGYMLGTNDVHDIPSIGGYDDDFDDWSDSVSVR